MPSWCRASPAGTLLDVVVQPRASREGLGPLHGDRVKVRVHAPPVDDAANEAVVELVAGQLGVLKSSVTIAAGRTGRRKTLLISGGNAEAIAARVAALCEG